MLWLITNRKLVDGNRYYDVIRRSVIAGIDFIILREKRLKRKKNYSWLQKKIKRIIGRSKTKLIVNSSLNVAKAVKADGLHVTFNDFLEKKFMYDRLIGVSVHTLDEAITAYRKKADYLLVSHIFETNCKKGLKPKGINLIKHVKSFVKIPVIALGGIKPDNIKQVFDVGADGAAVMSSLMSSKKPEVVLMEYMKKSGLQNTKKE